jgi:hypothetical protein
MVVRMGKRTGAAYMAKGAVIAMTKVFRPQFEGLVGPTGSRP